MVKQIFWELKDTSQENIDYSGSIRLCLNALWPGLMEVYSQAIVRPRYTWGNAPRNLYKATEAEDLLGVKEAVASGALGENAYRDGGRKTALHVAANRGLIEVVHLLLHCGFDPSAEDVHGNMPMDEAEYWEVKLRCPKRRQCRNLLAAFGGQRGTSFDVRKQRQKLENMLAQNLGCSWDGVQVPWNDNVDELYRQFQHLKKDPFWLMLPLPPNMSSNILADHSSTVSTTVQTFSSRQDHSSCSSSMKPSVPMVADQPFVLTYEASNSFGLQGERLAVNGSQSSMTLNESRDRAGPAILPAKENRSTDPSRSCSSGAARIPQLDPRNPVLEF